jgi:hypothetical protein
MGGREFLAEGANALANGHSQICRFGTTTQVERESEVC